MRFIISDEALNDIDQIWFYTFKKWSKNQADRYHKLIYDEIEFIAKNFELGKEFGSVRKDYKYSKVKSHLIFYKKFNENYIEIVRVLHSKMDINKRLME